MKAEHRHELKTNELAQILSNLPKWAKENVRMIVYFAVVITLFAGWYFWGKYRKKANVSERLRFTQLVMQLDRYKINTIAGIEKNQDNSFALVSIADKFRNFARNTKNDDIAALAYIKRGEALRSEIYYRQKPVDQQYLKEQTTKAKKAYEMAITKAQENPTLLASANYGVGLCAEELGNFDKAKEIYNQIVQNEKYAGTVTVASAEHRLKVMDDYKKRIAFQKIEKFEPVTSDTIGSLMSPSLPDKKIEEAAESAPVDDNSSRASTTESAVTE
jgi:tetratricopeptide (TPR) repeat protein